MPTRGYQSQSELGAHFGLGESATIDALTVTWPDGTTQSVEPPAVDQRVTIERQ
jgi:hypothetical protein